VPGHQGPSGGIASRRIKGPIAGAAAGLILPGRFGIVMRLAERLAVAWIERRAARPAGAFMIDVGGGRGAARDHAAGMAAEKLAPERSPPRGCVKRISGHGLSSPIFE